MIPCESKHMRQPGMSEKNFTVLVLFLPPKKYRSFIVFSIQIKKYLDSQRSILFSFILYIYFCIHYIDYTVMGSKDSNNGREIWKDAWERKLVGHCPMF